MTGSPLFFAIRHRRSGYFLPAQSSWGFTRAEPLPAARAPPRLFVDRGHAAQALNWWLKGESYEHQRADSMDATGESIIEIRTLPKADRVRSEMEIVVVTLTVESQDEARLRLL